MRASSLFAAAMTLATATAAFAAGPKPDDSDTVGVTLSSGIDYSSGAYGDGKDTDILVGLTNVGVAWRDFTFSASLPYLTITGPSFVVVGPGGVPVLVTPQPGATTTGRSGWGDLNLGATYSLPSEDFDDFDIAVTARTKVATADTSKGLSTGATDFSFYVDVSREFGIWGPFVNFGYRVPGKPSFYSFNDAPSFSIGTTVQLGDRFVAIGSYDFDGSISRSLADAQQMFASLSWLASDDISLTAYVEDGLSSGAPKVGTGLLVSLKVR